MKNRKRGHKYPNKRPDSHILDEKQKMRAKTSKRASGFAYTWMKIRKMRQTHPNKRLNSHILGWKTEKEGRHIQINVQIRVYLDGKQKN